MNILYRTYVISSVRYTQCTLLNTTNFHMAVLVWAAGESMRMVCACAHSIHFIATTTFRSFELNSLIEAQEVTNYLFNRNTRNIRHNVN